MAGFGNRLNQATQNPMFGAGIGLLSTGDWGGLLSGIEWANQARTRAEKEERAKKLQELIQQGQASVQPTPQAAGDPWFSPASGGADLGASIPGVTQDVRPSPGYGDPMGAPPGATPPFAPSPLNNVLQAYMQAGDPNQQLQAAQALHNQALQAQDWEAQLAVEQARQQAQLAKEERELAQKKELAQFNAQLKTQYPGAENVPSSVEEFQYFQSLGPEDQSEYLKVKRGDVGPSSRTEQVLYEASDAAVKARANIARYEGVAEKMLEIDPAAGVAGTLAEKLKAVTGQQDAATLVRKDYVNLKNTAAVQNLPPGIASDKDIELVMAGFLPENANPETIASFMRGLAKAEDVNAEYQEFKANYIAQNPARGAVGLNQAWREYAWSKWPDSNPGRIGGTVNGISWTVEQ